MLKPDSTRSPSIYPTRGIGPEWIEPDSVESAGELNADVVLRGGEDVPSDVALDLRLHDMLQQTCLATTATGAIIALAQGDRMVGRATLGEMAPGVGVWLNTQSGLSGACIQSREMELCDDTLADPRVNAIACNDLGIRSIVVLPVLDEGKLLGVLEVFSSAPRAFSDFDLDVLQSVSQKISLAVHDAVAEGSGAPTPEASSKPSPTDSVQTEAQEPAIFLEPGQPKPVRARKDYRTGALTVAVLALAVLLGWMVGRVGWSMAVNRAPAQPAVTPEEAQAAEPVIGAAPPAPIRREEPPPPPKPAIARPKTETSEPVGGLVVYEHGKVVFRMTPSVKRPSVRAESAKDEPAVVGDGAIQKAATREDDHSDSLAPQGSYILQRVEPEYPAAARQQHIQGPVVLNALVGTDGSVQELSVISGDALLVKAAIEAVRQWRFQPHQVKGQAAEFETRITVNFALPE